MTRPLRDRKAIARRRATLLRSLKAAADPAVKSWWEAYVEHSAPFIGVRMPQIRRILHEWYGREELERDPTDIQLAVALSLFRGRHAEEKLAGTLFLREILLPRGALEPREVIPQFRALFSDGLIADWNICDWFCVKVLGPLIAREGRSAATAIASWSGADNLWQARASVVAFVSVAGDASYRAMIRASAARLLRRDERWAKTAVGWILRDLSRHDRAFVIAFLNRYRARLSTESFANATKYFTAAEKERLVPPDKGRSHGG